MVFDKIRKNLNRYLSWDLFNYNFWVILFLAAFYMRFYRLGYYSLWLDEAYIANIIISPIKNIISGRFSAPVLFVFSTKSLVVLLGKSEFVLRFLPATFGTLSVVLIYLLCKNTTNNRIVSFVAVSLFAFNQRMLQYSQELKQYMGDVFFALLLFYLVEVYISKNYDKKYFIGLLATSVFGFYFSHAAVFIVPAVIIRILYDLLKKPTIKSSFINSEDKRKFISLIVYLSVLLPAFLLAYFFFLKNRGPGLIRHWRLYFFPSLDPVQVLIFISKRSFEFFTYLFSTQWYPYHPSNNMPLVMFVLFVIGFILLLLNRKYQPIIYFLVPGILLIFASAFKIFPFGGMRVNLFLTPFIFVYIAFAVYHLFFLFEKFKKLSTVVFLIIILFSPFVAIVYNNLNYPNQREHIRPVIEFYKRHKLPDDYTYVYYSAHHAFVYYHGLNDPKIIIGHNFRKSPINYTHEINEVIQKAKGKRLWLIFQHFLPTEKKLMINFVTKTGCKLIDSHIEQRAEGYLFKCD